MEVNGANLRNDLWQCRQVLASTKLKMHFPPVHWAVKSMLCPHRHHDSPPRYLMPLTESLNRLIARLLQNSLPACFSARHGLPHPPSSSWSILTIHKSRQTASICHQQGMMAKGKSRLSTHLPLHFQRRRGASRLPRPSAFRRLPWQSCDCNDAGSTTSLSKSSREWRHQQKAQ